VHVLQERRPGDVDAEMMEATTGYSLKYCEEILRDKVKAGVLERVYVRGTDGRRKTVFRKVQDGTIQKS